MEFLTDKTFSRFLNVTLLFSLAMLISVTLFELVDKHQQAVYTVNYFMIFCGMWGGFHVVGGMLEQMQESLNEIKVKKDE